MVVLAADGWKMLGMRFLGGNVEPRIRGRMDLDPRAVDSGEGGRRDARVREISVRRNQHEMRILSWEMWIRKNLAQF